MFENKDHFQAWRQLMDEADQADRDLPCKQWPDAFFPDAGYPAFDAKSLCAMCPIIKSCREYGIKYEWEGVYGGLSTRERQTQRRLRGLSTYPAQGITKS